MKKSTYKTGEHALTRKEYEKILMACGSQEDRVLVMMAVSLGIRRFDIWRIKIADIDLKEGTVSYHERKKGDRIRTVHIGPRLIQEIKILLNSIPKGQDTLFSIKDRQMYNRFMDLCTQAEIPARPFHALRATCIKFCQQAGWSPEQVSELTGDTIRVIQEHYSTPSKAEMKEVAQKKEIV